MAQANDRFVSKEEKEKSIANPNNNTEFFYTTPYLNMERIKLKNDTTCVVYDLSG